MDSTTAVVCLAFIGAVLYSIRLAIKERGDFEVSARAGLGEFVMKAKQRRK